MGNYFAKMSLYLIVGIFGMVIAHVTSSRTGCTGSIDPPKCTVGPGLYVAYALDVLAGLFYGTMGVFDIYQKRANKGTATDTGGENERTGLFA